MKYGLVRAGRLVRLTNSLRGLLESRMYDPFTNVCEVFEFTYSSDNLPVSARLLK